VNSEQLFQLVNSHNPNAEFNLGVRCITGQLSREKI